MVQKLVDILSVVPAVAALEVPLVQVVVRVRLVPTARLVQAVHPAEMVLWDCREFLERQEHRERP